MKWYAVLYQGTTRLHVGIAQVTSARNWNVSSFIKKNRIIYRSPDGFIDDYEAEVWGNHNRCFIEKWITFNIEETP